MSCSIKALLAPSPNYRWGEHLCLLAPLGTVMAFIIFCLGWWGEPVRQFFSQLAAADISITRFMSVITHIGNPTHLRVLFYVAACGSREARQREKSVRSALRLVQHLFFVLCHAAHKIWAGYAEAGISLASIPFGLYQPICFIPFRAYSDCRHRSHSFGTLVQKSSLFPFSLSIDRAYRFFPNMVRSTSPY